MDHSDCTFRFGEFLVFFLLFVFVFVRLKTPYTNLKSKESLRNGMPLCYACATIFSYDVVVNNTRVSCLYLK